MSFKMSMYRNLTRDPIPAFLGRDGTIHFSRNGIATNPILLDRGPGQAFGWFTVHPGCYAVITGPQDQMKVYGPGIHLVDNIPAGDTLLQLVKASPQLVTVNNISGQSQDAWPLSLDIEAKVVVNERGARSIVGQDNPLTEMRSLIAACALEVAETLTLAAFLGQEEHPLNSRQTLATAILKRVNSVPGVDGLMLIRLAVTNRRGDQQQINLNREATVARLNLETRRQIAQLEHQHHVDHLKEQQLIAEQEREIALYRAETARLEEATAQQACLDKAESEAQAKKLSWESAKPERDWELVREETLEKLDAVVEAFNALAKAYEEANVMKPIYVATSEAHRPQPGARLLHCDRNGYEASWALRITHNSFQEIIEDAGWGLARRHRLEEAIDRQARFVDGLSQIPTMMGDALNTRLCTFDLRFVYLTDEKITDVILLGKVFALQRDEAQQRAEQIAQMVSALLPFDYSLEPAVNEMAFREFTQDEWFHYIRTPQQIVEIRQATEMLMWRPDSHTRIATCIVTPFACHFRVLDQIGHALNTIDRDCMLSVSLRPTVLYPAEAAALLQLQKAVQWLAQNLPYDNERARLAADLYARQLQRPNGLLNMRVHLAGREPSPVGLSMAVVAALSHAEQEAKGISVNPLCVVRSAPPKQLHIVHNNLMHLEQDDWQKCASLPALQRLSYLVDTKGALAIFRLPVPSSQEIPGVGIGRSAMRSSVAQLALPIAAG